jgi:hypothetical protein
MSILASPHLPTFKHKGAGRRATAITHYLTLSQCKNIMTSIGKAQNIGSPFNRHSTFHYEAMGIPDASGHDAVAALIKYASDYLKTKGHRLTWVYTRENGAGKGAHAHILWHIPSTVSGPFFKRWKHWKNKLAKAFAKPGIGRGGRVLKTRCIGGSEHAFISNPQSFAFQLDHVVGYILKAAEPVTLAALSLPKAHEPGGAIIGRRAAYWQQRSVIKGQLRPRARKVTRDTRSIHNDRQRISGETK